MGQYRKLPVTVEARQWLPSNRDKLSEWCDVNHRHFIYLTSNTTHGKLWVRAYGAWCDIEVGDWIVMESDGLSFYPVKREVFASTYEPV